MPDNPHTSLHLALVAPVYNDWTSLAHLIRALDRIFAASGHTLDLYAINDGSSEDNLPGNLSDLSAIRHIEIIHLRRNVGHQRAIAMGLVVVGQAYPADAAPDAVIVMDAPTVKTAQRPSPTCWPPAPRNHARPSWSPAAPTVPRRGFFGAFIRCISNYFVG